MAKILVLLFALWFITACHVLQSGDLNRSVWFTIPVDSRLELYQSLHLGPYQDRVYFQKGAAMTFSEVNAYLPYCAISMAQKRTVGFNIEPDVFRVKRVYQQALFDLALRQQYLAGINRGNGMTYQVVATFMDLVSERQPDVEALICTRWGTPQGRSYLTLEDVHQSLGNIFTLELLQN